jgi:hypothetical protein
VRRAGSTPPCAGIAARYYTRRPQSGAGPRHGHAVDEDRADLLGAAHQHVVADLDDAAQHVLEVAGDGDLLHRVGDLAVLDPVAGSAARVVAGHVIHALAEQFGDQQAAAHQSRSGRRGSRLPGLHDQVVAAAGVAGGLHAELARRVGAQEVALQHAVLDHFAVARGDAVVVEGAAGQAAAGAGVR